jgi:hypothetical protein
LLKVAKMAHVVTAGELLDGHSVLDLECLDRIYLNAYVPILRSSGQVVAFMTQHLSKDDWKIDVMQPHLQAQAATGKSGVAAVGVSQEFQRVWSATRRDTQSAAPQYTFAKAGRRVTCYYFYLWDKTSVPRSSRSAPTSLIRPRSGSTGSMPRPPLCRREQMHLLLLMGSGRR